MFSRRFVASLIAVALIVGAAGVCAFASPLYFAPVAVTEAHSMTGKWIHKILETTRLAAVHVEHQAVSPAVLPDRVSGTMILLLVAVFTLVRHLLGASSVEMRIRSAWRWRSQAFFDWLIFLPLALSLRRGIIHSKIYA